MDGLATSAECRLFSAKNLFLIVLINERVLGLLLSAPDIHLIYFPDCSEPGALVSSSWEPALLLQVQGSMVGAPRSYRAGAMHRQG